MVKRSTPIKFNLYNDIKSFYKDTCELLMRHEEQNLIPLGNIIIGYEGKDRTEWREPASWFMATVSDTAGIKLTAIMTPPYNLTLYATDNVIDSDAISRLGLERGFSKCVLYTDLANPTSNSIYRKIGYRPICDSVDIAFGAQKFKIYQQIRRKQTFPRIRGVGLSTGALD